MADTAKKQRRDNIRLLRKRRNLTQEQTAERVERSRGLISQIETGETDLTEDMIYALANAYSVKPWELLMVDPAKDRLLMDINDALRDKPPALQAEVLGFIRGLLLRTT